MSRAFLGEVPGGTGVVERRERRRGNGHRDLDLLGAVNRNGKGTGQQAGLQDPSDDPLPTVRHGGIVS